MRIVSVRSEYGVQRPTKKFSYWTTLLNCLYLPTLCGGLIVQNMAKLRFLKSVTAASDLQE